MVLNIHLEGVDDKGKRLRRIVDTEKSFMISVVPVLLLPAHEVFKSGVYPADLAYPSGMIDILKECAKNPNITFGQHGFTHHCPDCYGKFVDNGKDIKAFPDPWHENRCLYNLMKSVDEQASVIQKGKNVIERILEASPIAYTTPNHQHDLNTKQAARELGYKYFPVCGILNVFPYEENGLVILPEREVWQRGQVFYTHYNSPQMIDELDKCLGIVQNSDSLNNLKLWGNNKIEELELNYDLLIERKRLRDMKKVEE